MENFIEIYKDHVKIREATKQGYAIATDGDSINLEQPNSKTRRGRVGHQIAQTLTCSCNQGVVVNMNKNKPILVGGIGEINFGKQYRQGNRVYNSDNIAMCLTANPLGNTGGYSYLYSINNERGNNMKEFKNETLTKLKFNMPENMKEVSLFDSFAGIGSLHNSLQFLGIPTKIIGLSETDVDATISYACIHIKDFLKLDFDYPSEQEMREWLINRNIGWDFQKQKSCIPRLKKDKLYKVYKASVLLDNYGDISQIDYKNLPDFDLFNFSFPCTDISNSGKQKGLKNEDGTPTRSGLVKYGINLVRSKRPKYIMIENVKALIQKKFINDFYDICNEIESYGYKIYYPTKEDKKGNKVPMCLNAKNYAIPQNRERIFVICVRNDCDDNIEKFWEGKDFGYRLKDFLEDEVDEKYYLSQELYNRFKTSLSNNKYPFGNKYEVLGTTVENEDKGTVYTGNVWDKNNLSPALTTMQGGNSQSCVRVIGNTHPSGKGMNGQIYDREGLSPTLTTNKGEGNKILTRAVLTPDRVNKRQNGRRFKEDGEPMFTLTAQDRHGVAIKEVAKQGYEDTEVGDLINSEQSNSETCSCNQGVLDGYRIRKLTPKECWRLMGFTDEQFDKAKESGISDSQLYKQAGNSIVVNCLYYIFKELFKNYIVK